MANVTGKSQPLRVLMVHGYTQNGPLFHAKTRALEKILQKTFPETVFSYPTGPLRLRLSEIPGLDLGDTTIEEDDMAAYAWWRKSDSSNPPEYEGIEQGLAVIAETLKSEGPFDGVIGFSQGGAMAAMIASLLEGESRVKGFEAAQRKSKFAIQYPDSFASLQHAPLKFCISYSGFIAPGDRYVGFYNPFIQTPVCHFIGSLDSVVEESRTTSLVNACGGEEKTRVVVHPGGHFVPNNRQYNDTVVAFIKSTLDNKEEGEEESVEDMDVPF